MSRPANDRFRQFGSAVKSLRRDPMAVATAVMAAAAIVLIFLVPEVRRSTVAMRVVTSTFLTILVLALGHGLTRIDREVERKFWSKLLLAYGTWLATDVLMLAFSFGAVPLAVNVAVELGFTLYCVFMVYAVESHVHRRLSPDGVDRLSLLAIVIFVFGFLLYFDVIPQSVRIQGLEGSTSSMWLFATVDGYVAARFVQLARMARTPRWRTLYSLFAAALAATVVGDVAGSFATQAVANVFYSLTAVLLIFTARLRQLRWRGAETLQADDVETISEPSWQTLLYALLFPAIHFLLYQAGVLEELYRPARETVVLGSIAALGSIAIIQHRGLIARRQGLESERELMIVELRAKSSELEKFAYTVSHDLKSPLVTIQGFLGLLKQAIGRRELENVEADIERISRATRKMNKFLDEILELSRAGAVLGEPKTVPLGELAREAVRLVGGRLSERGVTVKIDPDLPAVSGDRTRLLQVLQNLLDNAVKFMGSQAAPRVEISAWREADNVVCRVRDNGMGIEPRHQEQIFGLFGRLDTDREGSGIGLSLVKRIVESHCGEVWVESEGLRRGSSFYFTLPRATTGSAVDE